LAAAGVAYAPATMSTRRTRRGKPFAGAVACAFTMLVAPAAARGQAKPPPTVATPPGAGASATATDPEASPTPDFFDVNKYKADSGNPGAIRLPGTNVAIFIGGFAQLDFINDLQVIGNPDQFVVSSVPVGGGTGNTGSELSARQTRVFVETDAPWTVAPLLAYVEVDFFDPQNASNLHLRHAFGAVGRPTGVRLVAGYTWTVFMDATVIPSQLDYAGPVGLANTQQAQARLGVPFHQARGSNGEARGLEWMLSIEAPDPQVTTPMSVEATGYARWPDAVTALRWRHAYGHLLASALFRQVGIFPAGGARTADVGYGGNFTGRLSGFRGKDQLLWAVGGGRGVARYFAGSNGLSLDGFLQPDGALSLSRTAGGLLSYQHFFGGDRFSLTATASVLRLFDLDAGSDTTLKQLQYYGGLFQCFPNRRFMFGVQYLFGRRENRNGDSGSDNRVQASTQIKF
jgi:hypothetical protein